ncbi:GNAT family N-acetyltransferase [Hyunsoonleella aestuarii]|uniref:GNAT family N-acetyltransferase n=1 Tax=Hyunsoonleella aestuarii TaxID=912802 RepID=A0ABP8EA75_9FLAO|nr:GNAT family N-acetyltransferase [Hyunsoonleella aestuarii]
MTFYIETERLILRELRLSDLDGMFELDSNPEVHAYLGKKPVKTLEESVKILESVISQYQERGIGRFAAIEKPSGEFIGWSGIKFNTGDMETLGDKRDFYDIGYRFIPRYWGKGYATESSKAVLDFGFKDLDIKTICGAAEIDNIASNKVLQKIGLKYMEQFPYENEMINWYELKQQNYG